MTHPNAPPGVEETAYAFPVLVVRRPDVIRPILVGDIEAAGFRVTVAEDSATVLAALERDPPFAVLFDMGMTDPPPRPFFGLAAALHPSPRIIGLAPFGHDRGVAAAMELGAFCCLRLPLTAERLVQTVRLAAVSFDRAKTGSREASHRPVGG